MEQNAANQNDQEKKLENSKNQEINNMATLLEQEGVDIDFPRHGEIRTGVIASISQGQILISVGTKSEGLIAGREFDIIPEEELEKLEVGQEIPVYVVNPEDSHGNLVLSFMRAREEVTWKEAEDKLKSKESFNSKIIGYNKGGLLVPLGGLRGFVPASQVSLSRRAELDGDTPEEKYGSMVGQEIEVCVIEVDRNRRRLILSERMASSETRETLKELVIDKLEEGMVKKGRVTSLADFGAFVNISGADGLVHLSEISWDRIKHPKEVLEVGQEVEVKVISIDEENKRIGLSIRQLQEDPFAQKIESYSVGQLVEAQITRLTKFGAFAKLEEELEGLIHISEISEKRIEHPKEVLTVGDTVTLRVIKVDPDDHRIGLSLRKVESMAYADMDWKTLLDDELLLSDDESDEDEETDAETTVEAEAEVEETKAEVEEVEAEAEEEEEEEAAETEETESAEETEEESEETEEESEEAAE